MIISQVQPVQVNFSTILLISSYDLPQASLRKVPQLTSEEKAAFGYIEQKAQQMTIDDLMAKMGISEK